MGERRAIGNVRKQVGNGNEEEGSGMERSKRVNLKGIGKESIERWDGHRREKEEKIKRKEGKEYVGI